MIESPRPDPAAPDLAETVRAAYEAVDDLLTFTPAQTGRLGGWTPHRQRQFIVALAATGTVERSCRAVGMTVQGAYKLRKRADAAGFAHAWDEALAQGRERIFALALDRALNGYVRPRYYQGRQVGTVHAYDNRMVMHALNAPMLPPRAGQGGVQRGAAAAAPLSAAEAYRRDLAARIQLERAMAALVPEFDEDTAAGGEGGKV